ncbi:MAG: hypothetical protein M1347_07055 [Chloroflexi bacterium]|nr:hypothetical protein [Chloroflexota bacterium]
MRYARLLHDYHWMKYKSRTATPGWAGLISTPETVPLFLSAGANSNKDDLKLGIYWTSYLRGLNSPGAFKFIMNPPAGWFNKNKLADTLSFGGNIVRVKGIVKGSAKVDTFELDSNPPDPARFNFESRPDLVHKFTVVTRQGNIINPANGMDVYTFVIGRKPMYIPLKRLEFFPRLPAEITIKATTVPWLLVKDAPGSVGKAIGRALPLQKMTVDEYAPRGTYVWGRTDKGWIALCWYPKVGTLRYFTSWQMKTIPPVPPKTVS